MGKAWAKIVVRRASDVGWWVELNTDLPNLWVKRFTDTRPVALVRARSWSRRLGGIPVEVED